jgi:N-acetylglucosamine-6-phosphate deacetylase
MKLPYIDLQLNGAFGIDLNNPALEVDQVVALCGKLHAIGVERFLPTLITAPVERLERLMEQMVKAKGQDSLAAKMIAGIHLEGPFLSAEPGYIGAHPPDAACDANRAIAERLLEAGQGSLQLMTLAPERDPGGEVTRYLSDRGVIVFAGHTNASFVQLQQAIDQGLRGFTHLGNATPPQMPRHDNILWRVLGLRDQLVITLIADGHHLPPFLLKTLLELIPTQRAILVSDAVAAAGLGPGTYQLAGQTVLVGQDGAARSPNGLHFVGSAATLPVMHQVLLEHRIGSPEQHQLWLSDNARQLLDA